MILLIGPGHLLGSSPGREIANHLKRDLLEVCDHKDGPSIWGNNRKKVMAPVCLFGLRTRIVGGVNGLDGD